MFQLVYPFVALLLVVDEEILHLISFTILVLSSLIMAKRLIPKVLVLIFGTLGVMGLWCTSLLPIEGMVSVIRIYATCFLFLTLTYVLTRKFFEAETVTLQVIIGAMSGYLLIGFLGASIIEMIDFHHPGSFLIDKAATYDYYYFSFISLVTVGYGDIVPLTYPAKSLTILISVLGQFYMAIGLASLVGKFMRG